MYKPCSSDSSYDVLVKSIRVDGIMVLLLLLLLVLIKFSYTNKYLEETYAFVKPEIVLETFILSFGNTLELPLQMKRDI